MSGRPDPVTEALVEALRPFAEALPTLVAELVDEVLERRASAQPVEWLTVEEYAAQRRTTPDAVRKRLERGRIAGAVKDGKRWLIPVPDPADTLRDPTTWGERRANGPAPGSRRY